MGRRAFPDAYFDPFFVMEHHMACALNDMYTLSREELTALLEEACWQVWEDTARLMAQDAREQYIPSNIVAVAVQGAVESLWRQTLPAGRG
jgi:hypothetical protein